MRRFGLANPLEATLKGRATLVSKYATSIGKILERYVDFRMPSLCAKLIGARVTVEEFLYPVHNLYSSLCGSCQLQFVISGNSALCR